MGNQFNTYESISINLFPNSIVWFNHTDCFNFEQQAIINFNLKKDPRMNEHLKSLIDVLEDAKGEDLKIT